MPQYHLIIDASCGASGDMLLAALLDLQPQAVGEEFVRRFESLGLEVKIRSRQTEKNHLRCRQVTVETGGEAPDGGRVPAGGKVPAGGIVPAGGSAPLRHFSDIRGFVERLPFSAAVRERALQVFERIFRAEADVHGDELADVHLHELGADDSIVDIVGFCWLWEKLDFAPLRFTTLVTGQGFVETRHGRLPVPPPAVLKLVEGCRCRSGPIESELLTPTGAAILTTFGRQLGDDETIVPERTGIGCGERTFADTPNILRAVLSRAGAADAGEAVWVVEFTVDDMTGEALAHLGDRLLAAGALDYFIAAGQMKKGRSGFQLTVLCPDEARRRVVETSFAESTTIGLRLRLEPRIALEREERTAQIGGLALRYKVASLAGRELNRKPEYEDVRRLAEARGVSFKEAYLLAQTEIAKK